MSGSWSPKTGPNAPLRKCQSDSSIWTAVKLWTSRGFPASKILLYVSSLWTFLIDKREYTDPLRLHRVLEKRHPFLCDQFHHDFIQIGGGPNRRRQVVEQGVPRLDPSRAAGGPGGLERGGDGLVWQRVRRLFRPVAVQGTRGKRSEHSVAPHSLYALARTTPSKTFD